MNFHDFGHELAKLAVEAENDPAVKKVVQVVIDRLTERVVDETPTAIHPVVRHYAHVLGQRLERSIEHAAAADTFTDQVSDHHA